MTSHSQRVLLTHHLNLTRHTSGVFPTFLKVQQHILHMARKTISCVFPAPGSNGHMNEPAVAKQAILQASVLRASHCRRGGSRQKREEEKVGNSHTWKHFPEPRGFKRQTVESNNTLKQLRAAQSGSH